MTMIVLDMFGAARLVKTAIDATLAEVARQMGVEPDDIFSAARSVGSEAAMRMVAVTMAAQASVEFPAREIPTRGEVDTRNLIAYLELEALKIGTDDDRRAYAQRDGHNATATIARNELFKGFADIPRIALLQWHDAAHEKGCPRIGSTSYGCDALTEDAPEGRVAIDGKWGTAIKAAMTAAAGHPWLLMTKQATKKEHPPTVEWRRHWVRCDGCERRTYRDSALVTFQWAGRKLSREYAL